MTAIIPQSFDYAALAPDLASDARAAAHRIRERLRKSVCETGQDLIAIKTKMPGRFGDWIRSEFQWSERSAENYMNAAEWMEGKSAKFADLPPSAIYAWRRHPRLLRWSPR